MKFLIVLITFFARLVMAEQPLVLPTPSAPTMGLSKPENDKDTEGDFADVTGVSQNQARKDGRTPSAKCPNCAVPNALPESATTEFNVRGDGAGAAGKGTNDSQNKADQR